MDLTAAETCETPAPAPLGLAQAPIYVLTRFSFLGLSGWKSEASKDAELLFQPARLRQRLALFRALTLPSLAGQTDRNLRHVILTSDQLPDWALSALHEACAEAYGGTEGYDILVRPPGKAKSHLRYYLEKQDTPDPVIQIVLDDDDALANDFIARLREALPAIEAEEGLTLERLPFFLTSPVGYGLVLRPDEGGPDAAMLEGSALEDADPDAEDLDASAPGGAGLGGATPGGVGPSGATHEGRLVEGAGPGAAVPDARAPDASARDAGGPVLAGGGSSGPVPGDVALYRHKYPFINLGLTLLGTKNGKNIFAINHKDAPRRFGHRKLTRGPMFIRALHSFNDSRVTPTERWSKLENWRAEPDLAERFPFLLRADLAGLLAVEAEK